MRSLLHRLLLLAAYVQGVAIAAPFSLAQTAQEAAPTQTVCPAGLPLETRCMSGQDSAGAHYVIALPKEWNKALVLHAHGGPLLGTPRLERATEDLQRWSVIVKAGYAWAGSTYRQGGVVVRAAAEDTERLRGIFLQHVAKPDHTVLHGQSWGASVAAKGAETYAYDAVLLTSGVLAGGTRAYDFRLDLRVVYQYLCHNHPLPEEPSYPLWMGLPKDSALNATELAKRTRDCLGLGLPKAQRTPEQAHRLKTIVEVIHVPEDAVQGHLNWATFHFRDIALLRTGGKNVFGNVGAYYQGSDDDAALNAGVLRYQADPQAVQAFAVDTDPTGKMGVPVLSVSAVNDPVAFVEMQDTFLQTMRAAGTSGQLVQTFSDHDVHSYLSDPVYPALLAELLDWVALGRRPSPSSVALRCKTMEITFGAGCRFLPDFRPKPLDSRVVPRQRP